MHRTPKATIVAILATMALAVSLAPAGAVTLDDSRDNGDDLPASRNSANLELVAHIPSTGGTDIEFFSREMDEYKDAAGATVEGPSMRHFAMVGNQTTGAQIIDITSPETPYLVEVMDTCKIGQGDVQLTSDGMMAAIASQSGGSCTLDTGQTVRSGSVIVDMSDPYNPVPISIASESQGSHNNTLHPDGRYLYISTSALTPSNGSNSRIPIYDLEDPRNPKKVMDFMIPVNGPHDIRFSDDGKRAYFAGISAFHIVNTENPAAPRIISTIAQPGGSIGHDTLVTRDKRFLFVGDEGGGGGTYPCPGGTVGVYDLLDERAPIYLGAVEAGGGPVTYRHLDETPGPTGVGGCTSHVMALNPSGTSLTIGWYRLGTRIFDFSSFYNADGTAKDVAGVVAAYGRFGVGMTETGYMVPANANTWSAKQYAEVPGYIFSDDLALGFYVTKIKG